MAEDLQGLLNKIQTDGLKKAEDEKNIIIEDAKKQAAELVAKAKQEADELIKNAKISADSTQNRAEAAIKQAARDITIALKSDLLTRLQNVTKNCVGEAMTADLMSQLIMEMAKAQRAKSPTGELGLEVILAKKDLDAMSERLNGSLMKSLRTNPKISVGNDFTSGFQISFEGDDVFLDFSDEALSDIICEFTGPKLAAIIKS